MANMSRLLKMALAVNILLCAAFVIASYAQWQLFATDNETTFVVSSWNPISLTITHYYYANGVIAHEVGFRIYPNFPFLLFWVSIITNLYFIAEVVRNKEKQIK